MVQPDSFKRMLRCDKREHGEDAIGGARHRRRDNAYLARAHPTIEPCCIGVRFGYDSSRSDGSSEVQRLLHQCAPNALTHATGVHPKVL